MDTENNGNPWDLEAAPSCEIELNLGLSLGGCFGIGQSPRKVLERSSSVAFVSLVQSIPGKSRSGTAIKKTRSLPFEKKRRRDENIGRFENRTVRIASAPRSLFGSSDNQTEEPGNPVGGCERTKGMMEEMPCVSTIGSGPNGRRIEGFLYRYSKGEEVRIVCVCHGKFLSPAEFVKHAGGGSVAHPLKHIIVNTPRPRFS